MEKGPSHLSVDKIYIAIIFDDKSVDGYRDRRGPGSRDWSLTNEAEKLFIILRLVALLPVTQADVIFFLASERSGTECTSHTLLSGAEEK